MMKYIFCFLLIFCFQVVHVLQAAEKNNVGSLEGTVTDKQTGQPLAGVNVYIENLRIGAASDARGRYIIKSIPAGTYAVTAAVMGYQSEVKTEIAVHINRSVTLHFSLQSTILNLDDQIEVTAGYFDKQADRPVSSKNLNPQEIRSSAGSAEDIFRILQSMPGVSKTAGASANLIVRGGSPDENRTLLENIEVYSPLHFARSGTSMGVISIINPALLENVEFLTGGFPAAYGDKLSSVFEMKLKEGNQSGFNTDANLNISGFGLTLDGPVSDNSNIIFSARRGFFDYVTEMMGRPVKPRFWDLVGKVTYHIHPDHKISLVGFYYMDEFTKTDIATHAPYKVAKKYEYIRRDIQGSAVGINWHYLVSDRGYLLTTLSYTNNDWSSRFGSKAYTRLAGDEVNENEWYIRSELTYQLSKSIEIKGGGLLKNIRSEFYQWTELDTLDTGYILPADTMTYDPGSGTKSALFTQASWKPLTWFNMTAGLRMDYFELTGEDYLSPRFSSSFIISPRLSFNLAYGAYYQTPAGYQLALHKKNADLKSARATHYIAGVDYLLSKDTRVTLEVYYKGLDNLFVTSDTTKVIDNRGSGYASGVELFIQKKMSKNFVGSLSYTISQSRRKDRDFLPEYDFEYDQRHNISLLAGYKFFNDWRIGIKFQYATGMPYTPITGSRQIGEDWYLIEGLKNSGRVPDFHQLDLRIDKYFRFKSWTLTAYLDLWNVYNRDNVIYYSYEVDEWGQISRSASYDFPTLPIVGFSARF